MWIAKIKIKHDCIIGNRCEKFKCISIGYPLDFYDEKGYRYYFHFEKLEGEEKNIKKFIESLKKDKNVLNLEAEKSTVFFTYKTKIKEIKKQGIMPTQTEIKKVFYVKPVLVDNKGVEHWEIGSFNKEPLIRFIDLTKKQTKGLKDFVLSKIIQTKLKEIHFPHIMPLMTDNQKKALDLAKKEGYYEFPRKIELKQLAKIMKISLSTYREHLRKAEKLILCGL